MSMTWDYVAPAVAAGVVVHGLVKAAEHAGAAVLLDASQPLVPVDTGDLKASGHVEEVDGAAAVVYDVTSPEGYPYGIRVHEDEAMNHPNGGQAHFLADPMHTAAPAVLAAMAAGMRLP